MPVVDAATLLAAWEEGLRQEPLQRALTVLSAAHSERAASDWAGVSIGERDGRLFDLREQLFGERIEVTAACPRCGERLEADFSTRDIGARGLGPSTAAPLGINVLGYDVQFHVPTSRDLRDATDPAVTDGRARLLERCIEQACRKGACAEVACLPPDVTKALAEEMARTDPLAELEIAVACASCGHEWPMLFDIAAHLWGDIAEWAERLLGEVHLLASTYGWTEREILRLSATRRRMYLDMLGA